MNPGIWMGLGAFAMWGLFPLYFRMLRRIPAMELVSHRVVWSVVLLALGLWSAKRWGAFWQATHSRGVWRIHLLTSGLIAINWLLYVWGVNQGRVLECSLGYFLNPLVSVGLGVVVLRERLSSAQWAGLALAGGGIVYLATRLGVFPWLSLTLAFSFGTYGLLKKRAPLGAVDGLFAETLLLSIPALAWIAWCERLPTGPLHSATALEWGLLLATGLVTTAPLLLFSMATRRIPLSKVGFLQYLTPTMQFGIGIWVFREPFTAQKLHGFLLVWSGLAVVMADGLWRGLGARRASSQAP